MPVIYHVTDSESWNASKEKGSYVSPSLSSEGFIHCSHDHQVEGVLQRYFGGKTGLVKLVIDTSKLEHAYVEEWSPSMRDTFPHIYGPINTGAVIEVIKLEN